MKKSFLGFLKDQFTSLPPVTTADLTGKTVVVTGANVGLGFEASKHFARMNPGKLILACRSEEKGKAAVAKIKAETGFNAVELWLLDLAKFSSVIAFADRFEKEGERLDVLVANAAVVPAEYRLTSDGWEESLQVNDISTSLLCLLLAPRAVETARKYGGRPRITIVSSEVHYWVPPFPEGVWEADSSFQYLNSKHYCKPSHVGMPRYMETKLLNVFFTRSLAELLEKTPVIVDTVNPGLCVSEIGREASGVMVLVGWIMNKILARTTEQGSRQLVHAALGSSDKPDEVHGQYLNIQKVEGPSDYVIGEAGRARQDKLWNDLIRELSKVDPRVGEIVRQFK